MRELENVITETDRNKRWIELHVNKKHYCVCRFMYVYSMSEDN